VRGHRALMPLLAMLVGRTTASHPVGRTFGQYADGRPAGRRAGARCSNSCRHRSAPRVQASSQSTMSGPLHTLTRGWMAAHGIGPRPGAIWSGGLRRSAGCRTARGASERLAPSARLVRRNGLAEQTEEQKRVSRPDVPVLQVPFGGLPWPNTACQPGSRGAAARTRSG
jgi:hypothetical protein